VRVGTHELYRERFEAAGVEFAAAGRPVDLERMESFRIRITESRNQLAAHAMVVDELLLDGAEELYRDSRELLQGCDAAVCHSMNLVGQAAIAAAGTPWASVLLCPGTLRSAQLPPMHFPSLGRWGNRLLWGATLRVTRTSDRRLRARLREISGLDSEVSLLGGHAPELNLVAASPAIAPIPSDLPTLFRVTGDWHHRDSDAGLSERVEDFLGAGPPRWRWPSARRPSTSRARR
jgi:UDP:flavonoid glycosyltransferase YjiC (YdhE family)